MDSIISWLILCLSTIVSSFWLIIKALDQREKYRNENIDYFRNKK